MRGNTADYTNEPEESLKKASSCQCTDLDSILRNIPAKPISRVKSRDGSAMRMRCKKMQKCGKILLQ